MNLDRFACDGKGREGSFDGGCPDCLQKLIQGYEAELTAIREAAQDAIKEMEQRLIRRVAQVSELEDQLRRVHEKSPRSSTG